MTYVMDNVLISSYSVSGGPGGSLPVESLTLDYAKISWVFNKTDDAGPDGSPGQVATKWSLDTNSGGHK